MRAAVLEQVGAALAVRDVPEPEGAAVEVRAAGINFLDVLIQRGSYPQMPELPHVPGVEVSGELDGRRVIALTRHGGGGYAERVLADERWLFDLPGEASFEEGASFLMTFLTAWIPLRRLGARSVLVHAAAGGVGSAAVQLARHLGAEVSGTASSGEKREIVRGLGAEPLAYEDEWPTVDAVIDPVGGEVFERSLRALAPTGTIVAIGYAGGAWPALDPALVVGRNISVQGLYLGRLMQLRPELVDEAAHELLALWREGAIKPLVGASFPLEQANEAHELIASRRSVGKVVLVP